MDIKNEKPPTSMEQQEWKYFCFFFRVKTIFSLKPKDSFAARSDGGYFNW